MSWALPALLVPRSRQPRAHGGRDTGTAPAARQPDPSYARVSLAHSTMLFLRKEVIAADCDTGGDGALLFHTPTTRSGSYRTARR